MSTPQNPRVRRKQKVRRTKQLSAWRAKTPPKGDSPPAQPAKNASK